MAQEYVENAADSLHRRGRLWRHTLEEFLLGIRTDGVDLERDVAGQPEKPRYRFGMFK